MIQEILKELPYSQLVEFCDLPASLFIPKRDSFSDGDLLNCLVQCIGGHRTWDDIICLNSHEKTITESLRVAVEARKYGHILTEECNKLLNDAWEKYIIEIEDKAKEIRNTLQKIKKETKEAYLYAQEILEDIISFSRSKIDRSKRKSSTDILSFRSSLKPTAFFTISDIC